jgi:mono/diheme cytochrome c family protein
MRTVLTVVAVLVILALAAVGFIYSGIYDVAATSPDAGPIDWALRTTQSRSVHSRAEEVQVPKLDDPAMIRTGLIHYHEMCAVCHGAPGIEMSEIGQGLNPTPPELAGEGGEERIEEEEEEDEEAAEAFWVVKNGIKMTGMPSFGVTHSDEEIWAIVAFLERMRHLSPEEYQRMVQEAGLGEAGTGEAEPGGPGEQAEPDTHEHTHAPGTPH